MNEITHIHLGRQAFTIALDAHKELRQYLDAIKKESNEDVVEEVELRMAELLTERGIGDKKVILHKDVSFIKMQLGEPNDFKESVNDDHEGVDDASKSKRLFRDTDHGMIAGVAAGLAAYFKVDVLIVRLLFVALAFSGGTGVIVYIILWLLVPEAKTGSQRLQMSGRAVTVQAIKDTVEKADVAGVARRTTSVVSKTLMVLAKILSTIIGIGLLASSLGVLITAIMATVFMFVHGLQLGDQLFFPLGAKEDVLILCASFLFLVVACLLGFSGLALIRRKWLMPGWALGAVIGIFLAAVSVGAALGTDFASHAKQRYASMKHTQSRTVSAPFHKINVQGQGYIPVDFQISDSYSIAIHTVGKVNPNKITLQQKDDTLTVNVEAYDNDHSCELLCPYGTHNIALVVYAPANSGVIAQGADGAEYRGYVPATPDLIQ